MQTTAPSHLLAKTLLVFVLTAVLSVIPGRSAPPDEASDPALQDVVMARLEKDYAAVLFANGTRSLIPLKTLSAADRARLATLAAKHPLPRGKSHITTVATTEPEKKTLQVSKTEGAIETVQLCPPNLFRNQTASFCALYARVHWLDIAGYYVKTPDLYAIEGLPANPDDPWTNPKYGPALDSLVASYVPASAIHEPPSQDNIFDWIRAQVRKGRPVFAALTHEIWQALPPAFIAAHGWDGGKEGHAIVINGFVWNNETHKGSFHLINSWQALFQFDLPVENAEGMLAYPRSLTPKGTIEPADTAEQVTKVTLLETKGRINIYKVETNLGIHKVAAPDEAAARAAIESAH
jgi:hypothetical protein